VAAVHLAELGCFAVEALEASSAAPAVHLVKLCHVANWERFFYRGLGARLQNP
jgi:hypothetical protein